MGYEHLDEDYIEASIQEDVRDVYVGILAEMRGGVMMDWIKCSEKLPNENQNVIAIGTWNGEINGEGESEYMGIGEWKGSYVEIDSDTYSTQIINVTHWMPLPEAPKE